MAKKYFGTDGVRGEVGQFPINPDFVLKLGYAAGQVLVQHEGEIKPTVLIGKDTLHKHALEGFNAMPAKGGNGSLSDDEVKAAVDYMANQSGAKF